MAAKLDVGGIYVVLILIAAILGGIFDSILGFALGVLLTCLFDDAAGRAGGVGAYLDLKAIKGEPVQASGGP